MSSAPDTVLATSSDGVAFVEFRDVPVLKENVRLHANDEFLCSAAMHRPIPNTFINFLTHPLKEKYIIKLDTALSPRDYTFTHSPVKMSGHSRPLHDVVSFFVMVRTTWAGNFV